MSVVQRQFVWLMCLIVLLVATWISLPGSSFLWRWGRAGVAGGFAFSLLLAYAWVRFCIVMWRPLYRHEVSPGWCVALLTAFFAVVLQVIRVWSVFEEVRGG